MAQSTIKSGRPIFIISGEYTANNGYFTIYDSRIKTDTPVVVQIVRGNNEWETWNAFPRIDANGSVNVFLRNWNGVMPSNGTKFNLHLFMGGVISNLLYYLRGLATGVRHDFNHQCRYQNKGSNWKHGFWRVYTTRHRNEQSKQIVDGNVGKLFSHSDYGKQYVVCEDNVIPYTVNRGDAYGSYSDCILYLALESEVKSS